MATQTEVDILMTKKELLEYIERSNLAYIKSMWLIGATYKTLLFIKYCCQSTIFSSLIPGYEMFALIAIINTLIDGLIAVSALETRRDKLSYCHKFFSSLMSEMRLLLDLPNEEINKAIHRQILKLKTSEKYTIPLQYFSRSYNLDGYGQYSGNISPAHVLSKTKSIGGGVACSTMSRGETAVIRV